MGLEVFIEHKTKRSDAPPVMLGIGKGRWQVATDSVTAYAVRYCLSRGLRFLVDFGLENAIRVATYLTLMSYERELA